MGAGRPAKGPADALVTIVEFGAFDCDECRALQPRLKKLLDKYPKDVRLVFRNLAENPKAKRMAEVAMAAHQQGKFWAVHDELMDFDGELTARATTNLAKKLGLKVDQLTAALQNDGDDGPATLVQSDLDTVGVFRGQAPAPLFFVNGRYLDRNPSFEDFDRLVVEEKAKAETFMAEKKVPKAKLYETMRATWRGYANTQRAGQGGG